MAIVREELRLKLEKMAGDCERLGASPPLSEETQQWIGGVTSLIGEVPVAAGGKNDAAVSDVSEEQLVKFLERAKELEQEFERLTSKSDVSWTSQLSLFLYGVSTMLGALGTIIYLWNRLELELPKAQKSTLVVLMVLAFGCLGGSLRLTNSLIMYLGKDCLKKSWIWYYLVMPLEGAAMGLVMYQLGAGGWLQSGTGEATKSYANNLSGLWLLAVVGGMCAKNVSRRLGEVADILLGKPSSLDALPRTK